MQTFYLQNALRIKLLKLLFLGCVRKCSIKKKIIILSNRDLPAEEKAKEQVKALISLMHPILISAVAG